MQDRGLSIAGATVVSTILLSRNLQPVGNLTHLKIISPKQTVICVIVEVETKCYERLKETK